MNCEIQEQPYVSMYLFPHVSTETIGKIFMRVRDDFYKSNLSEVERELNISRDLEDFDTLKGVTIYERRNWRKDTHYKCVEFALSTVDETHGIGDYTDEYLMSLGYTHVTDGIQPGDIVVYRFYDGKYIKTKHMGIFLGIQQGSAKIRSKFGNTHILDHDINAIDIPYGNVVSFYRKPPQPTEY